MADCDLCGVSRPTLCPVKVIDYRVKNQYPTGTWRGLNEECLYRCHEANVNRTPIKAKRCDLCGISKVPLFEVRIQVPTFEEPYNREEKRALCESCLEACEESLKRREAEKEKEGHH